LIDQYNGAESEQYVAHQPWVFRSHWLSSVFLIYKTTKKQLCNTVSKKKLFFFTSLIIPDAQLLNCATKPV
jgi:hypothetical protein